MRKSSWTPSIVPRGDDHDVYLIVDDLGRLGRLWRQADYEATDFETIVTDLLDGQYSNPTGVFAFNTTEGWSWDASGDVAIELHRRCNSQVRDVPEPLQDFVDRHNPRSQTNITSAWCDREMRAVRGLRLGRENHSDAGSISSSATAARTAGIDNGRYQELLCRICKTCVSLR